MSHRCRDCGRYADQAEFRPDRRTRSGLASTCTPCRSGTRRWTPEAVHALAMTLLPQERDELWRWLTPVPDQSRRDSFSRSVEAIDQDGRTGIVVV